MLRAEPTNTRIAGMKTIHSTMYTLLQLNIKCGQKWIQFELQNSLSRIFTIDGKMCTAI